ncbi:MAG: ATP-binding protein [Kiritimatiellae bacterium]|nr:ATP-binding protein [Kiritimatiellia bacterium]
MKRSFYIDQISPFIDKGVVKVFTGIRRCGKSHIMGMVRDILLSNDVRKDQIVEANFESKKIDFVKTQDLVFSHVKVCSENVGGRRLYLLFDEIQELEGWEKLVNALLVDFDVDVYLTGSNAKLLSGELATYLGGRYVEIHVFPLSFGEVLEWRRAENPNVSVKEVFRRFVREGGMPFIHDANIQGDSAMSYLSDVFGSVVVKDIAKRHKVRDIDLLERILTYLISEVGHVFSASSIKKYLRHENRDIALETLYNYLKYAEEACLTVPLKRTDLVGKRVLTSQEKIYLADHGFREALFGNNEASIDQILENIVATDLVRRGFDVSVGLVGKKEVDFVAERGRNKFYVQVAYLMPTAEIREREFSVLEQIRDNYPKYVLSMDEMNFSRDGIIHRPIDEFLLDVQF